MNKMSVSIRFLLHTKFVDFRRFKGRMRCCYKLGGGGVSILPLYSTKFLLDLRTVPESVVLFVFHVIVIENSEINCM